jgi:hypothetical protein
MKSVHGVAHTLTHRKDLAAALILYELSETAQGFVFLSLFCNIKQQALTVRSISAIQQ